MKRKKCQKLEVHLRKGNFPFIFNLYVLYLSYKLNINGKRKIT